MKLKFTTDCLREIAPGKFRAFAFEEVAEVPDDVGKAILADGYATPAPAAPAARPAPAAPAAPAARPAANQPA